MQFIGKFTINFAKEELSLSAIKDFHSKRIIQMATVPVDISMGLTAR